MKTKRWIAALVSTIALTGMSAPLAAAQEPEGGPFAFAAVAAPTLTAEGTKLKWTAVPGATKYRVHKHDMQTKANSSVLVTGTSYTTSAPEGSVIKWKVKAAPPTPSSWSNSVLITYGPEGETEKEREEREKAEKEQKEREQAEKEQKEREAKEKAEKELKEQEEREKAEKEQKEREQAEKEAKEKAEREQKEKEEREKEKSTGAGQVKMRIDAKSYADSVPIEWFKKLSRVMAYPTAGDRYPKAGVQTIAYHDAWTTWGSSGATHKSEYQAWAARDKSVGYAGQFMDDINFQGGNVAGTRQQYRELVEAIRVTVGPTGLIEINCQFWNIWPLIQAKDPNVLKTLEYVDVVTKEFNVDPTAGINSSTKYKEFFEYVEFLRVTDGVHITMTGDSSHNTNADKEYSLATYYLLNDGGDFIGFSEQKPGNEYAGLNLNIGEATSGRERGSDGVYKRSFAGGVVYAVEPGGSTKTIQLSKPMKRLDGSTVTSVTVSPANGAVLRF